MKKRKSNIPRGILLLVLAVTVLFSGSVMLRNIAGEQGPEDTTADGPAEFEPNTPEFIIDRNPVETNVPEEPGEPENDPEPPEFQPRAVPDTEPGGMLAATGIMVNDRREDSYEFPDRMDFGFGSGYAQLPGIITFRGNNFRGGASYGYADIVGAGFGQTWTRGTGTLTSPRGATWTGHGWTGQPLIVKWPEETRQIMNMYDWAKEKDGLVEVVYASMDGYVYFSELETGRDTRDRLNLGFPFKGAGALDPRGYPLLYVGAGDSGPKGTARIFVVSLIDGSILYTFGSGDSFALRNWSPADASPLVCADTDRLIYPSENGIIYIIKLNSAFDLEAGTMTINPTDVVKWRYNGQRSHSGGKYWLGIESSPVIWRGHLIFAENGGHLVCLDLNKLEVVWVQDVLDDTNCSPVLELEDGHPYIYIGTSFHGGWRAPASETAVVPFWKIDAATGEIVWRTEYTCLTVTDVSGGIQGTSAIGNFDLGDLIFVPVARTPTRYAGRLAALSKQTGEIIWEFAGDAYAWSSPVCVYDKNGRGYVIYCTSGGHMYLLDGLTGKELDSIDLGGTIEASAAVYENTVVIGTRSNRIWGVQLT